MIITALFICCFELEFKFTTISNVFLCESNKFKFNAIDVFLYVKLLNI